jgi:hypothetical protein
MWIKDLANYTRLSYPKRLSEDRTSVVGRRHMVQQVLANGYRELVGPKTG